MRVYSEQLWPGFQICDATTKTARTPLAGPFIYVGSGFTASVLFPSFSFITAPPARTLYLVLLQGIVTLGGYPLIFSHCPPRTHFAPCFAAGHRNTGRLPAQSSGHSTSRGHRFFTPQRRAEHVSLWQRRRPGRRPWYVVLCGPVSACVCVGGCVSMCFCACGCGCECASGCGCVRMHHWGTMSVLSDCDYVANI